MYSYLAEYTLLGVFIGIVFMGAAIGAIPAICGAVKHKIGLAIGGFFACLGAQFLMGLILSIPMCALFLFFIFKKPKTVEVKAETEEKTEE